MDKEAGIFLCEKGNSAICYNVDDPGGYYAKWNMSDTTGQIPLLQGI